MQVGAPYRREQGREDGCWDPARKFHLVQRLGKVPEDGGREKGKGDRWSMTLNQATKPQKPARVDVLSKRRGRQSALCSAKATLTAEWSLGWRQVRLQGDISGRATDN